MDPADDLADLLAPRPADDGRRAEIVRLTSRVVARRARIRRAVRIAGTAGVFVVGGLAGWFAQPAPEPVVRTEYVTVPAPVPPTPPPPAVSPSEYVSADRVEQDAERSADRAASARLYRLAGDKYLPTDPGQAARCYRLFLMHAAPADRSVSADDSWLLITLKRDRKETTRGTDQGL
jgi:hypothetical protein